jgi:hypothetical protein
MLTTTLLAAHDDHVGHEVSDDEFVSGARSDGSYRALCGEQILAAPLEVAPFRRCPRCAATVAMLEGTGDGNGTTWLEPVTDEQYKAANDRQ